MEVNILLLFDILYCYFKYFSMFEEHKENQGELAGTQVQDEAEYSAQERRKQIKIDGILD